MDLEDKKNNNLKGICINQPSKNEIYITVILTHRLNIALADKVANVYILSKEKGFMEITNETKIYYFIDFHQKQIDIIKEKMCMALLKKII